MNKSAIIFPKKVTEVAVDCINDMGKKWLAKKILISVPTLNKRMEDHQWTVEQANKIQEIHEFLF